MLCKNCGANVNDGDQFCNVCGTPVTQENQNIPEQQPDTTQDASIQNSNTDSVFCTNCGSPIEPSTQFCTVCGARSPIAPEISAYEMGVETPASKKIKKPLIIAIIVAAVIVLGSAIAFAFPYISNGVMKLVLSPEDYLVYVVNNSFDDIADDITKTYSTYTKNFGSEMGGTGNITITAHDELYDTLSTLDIDSEIIENIEWLEKVSVDANASYKDDVYQIEMSAELNDESLGSIDYILDSKNSELYLGVPEYLDDYICVDMSSSYDTEEMAEFTETFNSIIEALPDEKLLNTLLCSYAEEVAKSIEDVEKDNEKLEADDISQNVTVLSFELSEETLFNVTRNVLEKAKDDKNFKKLIENFEEIDDIDISYDDVEDAIENALDELENAEDSISDDAVAEMEIYVNGKGEIVGISVDVPDGNVTISAYTASKGSKTGVFIGAESPRGDVSIEGSYKDSFGKRNGNFTLTVPFVNDVLTFDMKDVNVNLLEKGVFAGTFTVKPAKGVSKTLKSFAGEDVADLVEGLSIVIKSNSKSAEDVNSSLSIMSNSKALLTLDVVGKTTKPKNIKTPDDYIDVENIDDEDLYDSINFDALVENLSDAGLPSYLVDELKESIEDANPANSYSYYNYDYDDYYYDDYDDYDYDDYDYEYDNYDYDDYDYEYDDYDYDDYDDYDYEYDYDDYDYEYDY